MTFASRCVCSLAALWLLLGSANAAVPRQGDTVGIVVSARGDELIRFSGVPSWQRLDVGQQLLPDDEIRTGTAGSAAVLFEDDTRIRIHRNSRFVVEQVRSQGIAQSRFRLLRGAAWSRAKQFLRGVSRTVASNRETVQMITPVATIGIRGTDWHVQVGAAGETQVTVLTGEVALFNALGEVSLTRGEQGEAVAGRPPTKRVLVDVLDRPLFALEFEPRWFENMTLGDDVDTAARIARQTRLMQIPAATRTSADRLALARVALDRNQLTQAAEALADERRRAPTGARPTPEQQLIEGMRLARSGYPAAARSALESASAELSGRDRSLAGIALAGLDLLESRYAESAARLDALEQADPKSPNVAFHRALLPFFSGDDELTRARILVGEARFAQDARFPALASVFHITQGEDADARRAFERALQLDPRNALALMARGQYFHEIEPDAKLAENSIRASAESIDTAEAWNNLGLVYQDLGSPKATQAFETALRIDPDSPLVLTNFATHLLLADEIESARDMLAKAKAIKPGYSQALLLDGLIALFDGQPDDAVERLTQASVADPSLLQIYTGLGFAHYQAEEFPEADEALEQARRLDPDDPTPLVVSAIIAQDQAQAGEAIRYSREALELIRKVGSFAVEDIASASSGLSNLGFAYVNLGMADWGEYYAQRAFSPYTASDHFLLATQYGSGRAQEGERAQGLLLDPMAVSFPNRYYEAVRTPRTDLSISGSLGDQDGADTGELSATLQGFARLPTPVAWSLNATRTDSEGFRLNTRERTESLQFGMGTRFNHARDQLLWTLSFDRGSSGLPGEATDPDPDDDSSFRSLSGAMGWQHRFDYDNRLLARVGASSSSNRIRNAQPFGTGLDDLTYSLLFNFGEDDTRDLALQGLFDVSELVSNEDNPVLLSNSPANQALCVDVPILCANPINLSLPARIDSSPLDQVDLGSRQVDLQVRHLLTLGDDLDLSYGAEWTPQDQDSEFRTLQAQFRGDGLVFIDAAQDISVPFDFVRPQALSETSDSRIESGLAYVQGRLRLGDALAAESGAFIRHVDTEDETRSVFDPRLGLNWEPRAGHWLRLAHQRETGLLAPSDGTLAPVATAGLTVNDLLPLDIGQTVRDTQLRWDAEWGKRLYTVVLAEHQDSDGYSRFFEFSSQGLTVAGGRATQLVLGSNLWFAERFGAFGRYTRIWSENTAGEDRGRDLPLLADDSASLGLSWVHPRQIRVSGAVSYSGKRWGDVANTRELDDFITTTLFANWQPGRRHWSFTLAAENLLDERFELAPGLPSPGASISLAAEYRLSLD